MTERGELVHDTTLARVILVFAFDVGQAVQLLGSQADSVLDELRFAERLELLLSGEPFAVGSAASGVHKDTPRLLQVMQEKDQECVRERER